MSSLKPGNPAIALTTSFDAPATTGALAAATPSANHASSGKNRPRLQAKLSSLPSALKLNLRRGSHRTGASTGAESEPLGLLCVRVIAARNLASKDRNGKSDPFLVFRVGEARSESECIKACLNPVWGKHEGIGLHLDQVDGSSDKEAFCVAPIWAETLSSTRIEVVAWDKDSFRRSEYLGEISLGIEDWLDTSGTEVPVLYHDPKNTVGSHLISYRQALIRSYRCSVHRLFGHPFLPHAPSLKSRENCLSK
jgi:phosphatidylserine decarboxylase